MCTQKGEETLCFPEDILMEEILSRVPVKSLLKFRCVSKSWCHLIGSKKFVKTHLKNSIKSTSFAHHRIILNTSKGLGQCSLPSLLNEPFIADSITDNAANEINVEGGRIDLVGCCNGLVCILEDRKRFILWNPATKKSRNLPDFDNKMEYISIRRYGFGLDEVNNDYKVFGIPRENYGTAIGIVYSLRSNSWKVIEKRDDSVSPLYGDEGMYVSVSPFYGASVYVSGKLHWCINVYGYKCEIVSFDLNSHVYGVVELPTYSDVEYSYRLGVHNGFLIVLGVHQKSDDLDIWMMKEYGVKETWDKIVIIPCSNDPYHDNLVAIGPNGEVLLIYRSIVTIYNPKYNLIQFTEIFNYAQFFQSGVYIESLASVDPS